MEDSLPLVLAVVILLVVFAICWCCVQSSRISPDSRNWQSDYVQSSRMSPDSRYWQSDNVSYSDDRVSLYAEACTDHRDFVLESRYPVLDLHNLTVSEAMKQFKEYLAKAEESNLYGQGNRLKYIHVIPGRGKHSLNGIPKIKNALIKFIQKNEYRAEWINPGMVNIYLKKRQSNS